MPKFEMIIALNVEADSSNEAEEKIKATLKGVAEDVSIEEGPDELDDDDVDIINEEEEDE